MSKTTLRKVRVCKYDYTAPHPGGVIPKNVDFDGWFHTWGCEYEEIADSVGSYSVAIVERSDGSCVTVLPDLIDFIEPTVSE